MDYVRFGPLVYLKMISTQRAIWQKQDPPILDFDRAAALRDLPPFPGTYVELERRTRRQIINWPAREIPIRAGTTAVFALVMIPLLNRRRRRIAVWVLAVGIALIPLSMGASVLGSVLFLDDAVPAKTHAYCDDFVYVDGIRFVPFGVKRSSEIVAFEKQAYAGLRTIAFSDGSVTRIQDEQARRLLEAQGLEYPKGAAGERGP